MKFLHALRDTGLYTAFAGMGGAPTSLGKLSVGFAIAYSSMLASMELAHAQKIAPVIPAGIGSTQTTSYPPNHENSKLSSEHFTQINDVEAFPADCREAFASLTKEPAFSLANPRQPFQATDVMSPTKLPWRRLILGGITSDLCIIYYEKGGFVTSYAAVVIDISKAKKPRLVWGGLGGGGAPRDIAELIELITKGGFKKGDLNNW